MENKEQTPQPEIIYSLETMKQNRIEVLKIFNGLKGKFLNGSFTMNSLVKDYGYSSQTAHFIIDTLARNGLIDGAPSANPNSMRYILITKKERQIENIKLWLKRSEQEMEFFKLAIEVIQEEINEAPSTLKAI